MTAADNADASPDFGPYLVGVPLDNTFTATIGNDPDGTVASVAYSIDGGSPIPANNAGQGQWTFDPNVGDPRFTDEDHTLVVKALDANGNVLATSATYTIDMQDSLNYALTASFPGGPAVLVPVSQLRFIHGIDLTPTFTGTISDLPSYYVDQLQVQLTGGVAQPPDLNIQATDPGPGATFTFTDDTGSLPGDTDTNVALRFATDNGNVVAPPGSTPSPALHTINLPAWMSSSTAVYNAAAPADVFGTVTGAYVVDVTLPLLQGQLPDVDPQAFEVAGFALGQSPSSLSSYLGIGLHLVVYAKPTNGPGDAQVKARDAFARVTLLGQDLVDETRNIPDSDVTVTAGLDPDTLNAVTTIQATTRDFDLKSLIPGIQPFDLPFGSNQPNSWTAPLPGAGLFGLTASVAFNGAFTGQLVNLVGNLGVELDVSGSQPQLVKDVRPGYGTFVQIAGAAYAELNASATGSLGVKIIPIGFTLPVGTVAIQGTVGANLAANVKVDFSGPLTSPTPSYNAQDSLGMLNLYYNVAYDYAWFSDKVDPKTSGKSASDAYPIVLFGTPAPPSPGFNNPAGLDLTGPGDTASPGYPGAAPTQGSTAVQLGTTGPAAPAAPSIQALVAPAASDPTVSTLEMVSTLDDRTTSVAYDFDVLAGSSRLTPGAHWLDVSFVGPDGQEEVSLGHVDLSTLARSADDNPLGYASGWTRATLTVPSGALAPARPYHLVFRFSTDAAATGEQVAVLLDGLALGARTPRAVLSAPVGDLQGGQLALGAGPSDPSVAVFRLTNQGDQWLIVGPAALSGSGYALDGVLAGGFQLAPGDQVDLTVRQVSAAASNPGRLTLTTNDPAQPSIVLTLIPQTTASPPPTPPVIIGEQAVFRRRANRKGKPVGKSVLQGFTLEYSRPMGSSASDAADYRLEMIVSRATKKKPARLRPVRFTVVYAPSSDTVAVNIAGNPTFASGGLLVASDAISSSDGAALSDSKSFSIGKGGKTIGPD